MRCIIVFARVGWGSRQNRLPQANPGSMVMATVKKGKPDLRKKGALFAMRCLEVMIGRLTPSKAKWVWGFRARGLTTSGLFLHNDSVPGDYCSPTQGDPPQGRVDHLL